MGAFFFATGPILPPGASGSFKRPFGAKKRRGHDMEDVDMEDEDGDGDAGLSLRVDATAVLIYPSRSFIGRISAGSTFGVSSFLNAQKAQKLQKKKKKEEDFDGYWRRRICFLVVLFYYRAPTASQTLPTFFLGTTAICPMTREMKRLGKRVLNTPFGIHRPILFQK